MTKEKLFKLMPSRSFIPVVWLLGFTLATCISLIPTPLFELRYFNTTILFLWLHIPPLQYQSISTNITVWGIIISFLLVNGFLIYLFVYGSFIQDGQLQRFML